MLVTHDLALAGREKFIDIIRKSWRKMSPRAHQLALTIPFPDGLKELVKAAIAG